MTAGKVITDTLEEIRCKNCGITFSVPLTFLNDKHITGFKFYCPNGHELFYKKSTQSELDNMTKERDHWMAEAQRLLDELDKLRNKNKPKFLGIY